MLVTHLSLNKELLALENPIFYYSKFTIHHSQAILVKGTKLKSYLNPVKKFRLKVYKSPSYWTTQAINKQNKS